VTIDFHATGLIPEPPFGQPGAPVIASEALKEFAAQFVAAVVANSQSRVTIAKGWRRSRVGRSLSPSRGREHCKSGRQQSEEWRAERKHGLWFWRQSW
jgi:hypothetical protein